jgi:hypothetical protein
LADTYITTSGQTWDQIAYEVYGDEYQCGKLMDRNRDKLEYFVFSDGIVLQLPEQEELSADSVSSDYPTWRAALNGKG